MVLPNFSDRFPLLSLALQTQSAYSNSVWAAREQILATLNKSLGEASDLSSYRVESFHLDILEWLLDLNIDILILCIYRKE